MARFGSRSALNERFGGCHFRVRSRRDIEARATSAFASIPVVGSIGSLRPLCASTAFRSAPSLSSMPGALLRCRAMRSLLGLVLRCEWIGVGAALSDSAGRRGMHAEAGALQRADDLSALQRGIVLELFHHRRTPGRTLSDHSSGPAHPRCNVAARMDGPAHQSKYRDPERCRSRLGRLGHDRWHAVSAGG
jgi:hypothetical protein